MQVATNRYGLVSPYLDVTQVSYVARGIVGQKLVRLSTS